MKRKCGNCTFWEMDKDFGKRGECRRNTPSVNEPFSQQFMWPYTYNDQWCGEFKEHPVSRQKGPI